MSNKRVIHFIKVLIPCLIICVGGGWLTGLVTQHGVKTWYPHLIKPYGTPPDIVFPIVWTFLYTLMAISLTLLWISNTTNKNRAYLFFGFQLLLNFIWSWLFFYLQKSGIALMDLTVLWILIIFTIASVWQHTRIGSFLLIPYIVWVSYAFYLNLLIWVKN